MESRKFAETHSQLLDTMDLEQEKGVTIRSLCRAARWTARDGETYELNLIDTPGRVDFGCLRLAVLLQPARGAPGD